MPDLEPLYTADEVRAAERRHPGYPDSMAALMERAGAAVAGVVRHRFPGARRVTAVCGGGANGGDGRIAARLLAERGLDVLVVDAKAPGEPELGAPDVVIDALFGTGFSGAPRPEAARLIERVNALGAPVVSVDVPSGVDASTGEAPGAAVRASVTVTMQAAKLGLEVLPGRLCAGEVVPVDIGLDLGAAANARVASSIVARVPARGAADTKYSSAVLVVGGSRGLTGAAVLAACAAFRADAGYVALAAPRSALPVLETLVVEAVKLPLDEDDEGRLAPAAAAAILERAERSRAVALGPGLGRSDGTKALVRRLLAELAVPVVVDADALWELEPVERAAPAVLTPHEGELARLLGVESEWVRAHRLEAARRGAERFGCVCLLKGWDTLVAAPGEGVLVSAHGGGQLATAGTGDVLTGVVAAFLAKGLDPRLAAAAAAAAHGLASQRTPSRRGLVAGDVAEALPAVLESPAIPRTPF